MIMQQINLYRKANAFDMSRQGLMLGMLAVPAIILLLAVCSVFDYWRINRLHDSIVDTQHRLSATASRMTMLQQKIARQQVSPHLTTEVSRTEEKLHALQRLLQLLENRDSDPLSGFSRYFHALARFTPMQLWLSNISIDASDRWISLRGATQQPEQVAGFLQALEHAPVFKGRGFSSLTMQTAQDNPRQIDFTLSTRSEQDQESKK